MGGLRRLMGRVDASWMRSVLFAEVPGGKRRMSTHGSDWALVLNAGSSSLKYALYSIPHTRIPIQNNLGAVVGLAEAPLANRQKVRATQLATGSITEIGGQSVVSHKSTSKDGNNNSSVAQIKDFGEAFSEVVQHLTSPKVNLVKDPADIKVVGHRVVHGADRFSKATVITPDVELAIQDAARLAPLHNPANLLGIREAMKVFSCPHVAVFDTAFHTTMPPESYTYAIPLDLAAKHKIRKYGFHGTSYGFVMQQTAERLGKRAEDLNAIICHLGNGASMSCIRKGVCVDTTMGLTPLEGLVMGTRSGDVDPGVYTYLTQDMSPAEVDNLLNKASGLKGLCGHSDMQQVIVAADAGEENAQLALKVFVQRVRKYLGSYLVRLNGEVDAVVFTAGIGEHSAKVRTLACEGLETLGIALDPAKNAHVSRSGGVISAAHSHTKILVVPTDEELAICLQSYEAAGLQAKAPMPDRLPPKMVAPPYHATQAGPTPDEAPEGPEDDRGSQPDVLFSPMHGSTGVYIASSNRSPMTDSSVPEMGLMYALSPRVKSVGYFRPIAYNENDRRVDLVRKVFQIDDAPTEMYGVTHRKATHMLAVEEEEALIVKVMEKFAAYREKHDFVIVSGLNQLELPSGAHLLNTKLADALNLPMIWSTDAIGHPRPGRTRVHTLLEEVNNIRPKDALKHVPLAGIIATEIPPGRLEAIREKITLGLEELDIKTIAAMPVDSRIRMRTLREVANVLGAEVLCGEEMLDTNHVGQMVVGTLQVADILKLIYQGGGDRANSSWQFGKSSNGMPLLEVDECKKVFGQYLKADTDKISVFEIGLVMRSLGLEVSDTEVEMMLGDMDDLEGTSFVTFSQFMEMLTQQSPDKTMSGGSVLIVTHIGRVDLLLSLLMAAKSKSFPKISGILLTDGSDTSLPPEIRTILTSPGDACRVPVLSIQLDTFQATQRIHGLHGLAPRLLPTSTLKLQAASEVFAANASTEFIEAIVGGKDVRKEMTSRLFQYHISAAAKASRQRIVLPEGEDWRVITAAGELLARGMCDLIILGDREKVLSLASEHHVDISHAQIIDPRTADDKEDFVQSLVRIRGHKGMTEAKARQTLEEDFTWYGTMMMEKGLCDGMVSGAIHTTADTMRPALQIIKTGPGVSLVSSVFFMLLPDRVYLFGDCAINVDPTAEELCQIALSCAETAVAFGIEPRVAMLSYATGTSNSGPIVEKVRLATQLAKVKAPLVAIEGPTQFDAAVDKDVAAIKLKGAASQVAGRATVCVFPDLNSGNHTYKAVQQAARCIAIGPIMQGLRLPVNDLSRGCTVGDVVNTVIITCNQAISAKQRQEAA